MLRNHSEKKYIHTKPHGRYFPSLGVEGVYSIVFLAIGVFGALKFEFLMGAFFAHIISISLFSFVQTRSHVSIPIGNRLIPRTIFQCCFHHQEESFFGRQWDLVPGRWIRPSLPLHKDNVVAGNPTWIAGFDCHDRRLPADMEHKRRWIGQRNAECKKRSSLKQQQEQWILRTPDLLRLERNRSKHYRDLVDRYNVHNLGRSHPAGQNPADCTW